MARMSAEVKDWGEVSKLSDNVIIMLIFRDNQLAISKRSLTC